MVIFQLTRGKSNYEQLQRSVWEMPQGDEIAKALDVARMHGLHKPRIKVPAKHFRGPIHSSVAGRTDHLPMTVHSGSYVLPADVVGHLGESSTIAGFKNLRRMFTGIPRGGGSQPYNQEGGPYGMATGGSASGVPIVAAGGEYVLDPDEVRWAGGGDLETGHKVLDQFVKHIRAELIHTLKKLPGPKKD